MDAIPPFVFLILALALLATAGGLGIWLFDYVRSGGKRNTKDRRSPPADSSAEAVTLAPTGEQELLRVSRMEGEVVVLVQGQRYRHLREIEDPQAGREAIEALKATLAFAEGWLPSPRRDSEMSAVPAVPAVAAVDEDAFLEQLRQPDLFSLAEPSGLFGRKRKRTPSTPLTPLLTPADEINDLLQQLLRKRPDLDRYKVTLTTGEDGGLCIHVGAQTFAAVDDVPDLEVRSLIQDAIREWKGG